MAETSSAKTEINWWSPAALALAAVLGGCSGTPVDRVGEVTTPVACAVTETVKAPLFDQQRSAELRATLTDMVDRGFAPGVVMLIEQDGKIVFDFTYGFADREDGKAMKRDSLFRLYSMTKPITSIAALQLVDEGVIALDDPVAKYLPSFLGTMVANGENDVALGRAVTIRDLLTHQAGMTYGYEPKDRVSKLYARRGVPAGPGVSAPPLDGSAPVTSNSEMAERIASIPLMNQPGEAFTYGNATDVLGHVLEVATGQPLEDLFERQIFDPADMDSTGFVVAPTNVALLTSAYVGQSQFPEETQGVLGRIDTQRLTTGKLSKIDDDETSFMLKSRGVQLGGAGLAGTAGDYLRFTKAVRTGALVSPELTAQMSRNQLSASSRAGSENLGILGFGYGFAVKEADTQTGPIFPQCGYFWGGAASTHFWIDPYGQTSGVMMTQLFGGDVKSYWLEVLAEIYAERSN